MVRRKNIIDKILIPKKRRVKDYNPKVRERTLTSKQISDKLKSKREITLNKIIESPYASPTSKERARKLLLK
jgi:hypothetical protein